MIPRNIDTSALDADIKCLEFHTDNELSRYTDSMLFDSHNDEIAYGEFEIDNVMHVIRLEVNGYIRLYYKDEVFVSPSEFPEELKNLIKTNPLWADDTDIDVRDSNQFEYIIGKKMDNGVIRYYDGIECDDVVSELTEQDIFNEMVMILKDYIL